MSPHVTGLLAVLALHLAVSAAPLAAQGGVLRGRVVHAGQPVGLPDADLVLGPSGITTRTDPRGYFELRGLSPGQVELTVRRVGFAPASVVLQVDGVTATEVDITLEPLPTVLDPIVTSVTRDARSLSEVAAAVSVADSAAIGRGRTVGLHETLRMMPGVQAASQYGTDQVSIGIRGSAARGSFALRGIAVLVDGIPLTESDGRSRLDLIELAAARQIEVVRGPASAVYPGSPGGVVNVVSRSGWNSRGISGRVQGGAFGFRKYDGQAGGVFAGGRGSAFAAASNTYADGYRAHSDGSTTRGQVALEYLAGSATRVAFEAHGSRLALRLPGTLSQPELDADPDAAAPWAVPYTARRGDTRYRAGVRVEQAFSAGTASGYLFYGGRTLLLVFPIQFSQGDFHRLQGGTRFHSGRVAGAPIDATVGFDYDILFGTTHGRANLLGEPGDVDHDSYISVPNIGVYSQAEFRLSPAASATLGLRYDRVAYRFETYVPDTVPRQETVFDHLSPRISALWSPDSATSLYASVGRGSEFPVIEEVRGPSRGRLRPKSLWNYEVGGRRVIDRRVLLEAAVFYADVRGEFVPRTANGLPAPENASRSRNIGLELGMTARAASRLQLGASYALLDLRLRDFTSAVFDSAGRLDSVDFSGKLLPAVPRHRLTGEVRVRPLPALDVGVQLEWQSVVYVETGNARQGTWYFRRAPAAPLEQVDFRAVPNRALVHLDAAWQLGPATLFGSVENLLGHRYVGTIEANAFDGHFYEAGPPTSVSLGLRLASR